MPFSADCLDLGSEREGGVKDDWMPAWWAHKRECSQPPIWCDLKIRKNFSLKSATYIEIYRIKIWKDFMGIYSYNSTGG